MVAEIESIDDGGYGHDHWRRMDGQQPQLQITFLCIAILHCRPIKKILECFSSYFMNVSDISIYVKILKTE